MISRYVYIFCKDKNKFLYNSRTNSFYTLSDMAYDVLSGIKAGQGDMCIPEDFLHLMRQKKIFVTKEEDDSYYEYLKLVYLKSYFGQGCLSLTVVPTVMCNLRCPYCFEVTKPKGMMNDGTINKLIEFIKANAVAKKYSITWFGGEPLLGINVIEKILTTLENERDLERVGHSIVTNGTLLNKKARELFNRFKLGHIQITLDGLCETHNSKRFFESGKGSFDLILKNVEKFLEANPDTRIDFRVNVDNTNKGEYIEVHSMLHERFKGYSISVYPGILRANKGCENETFLTSAEHLEFSKMLWKDKVQDFYPAHCSKGCCATSLSSYVIGPSGELYPCWEHVGNMEKCMGYIDGKGGPATRLYARYKLHGHCFDDDKCLACGLLPVCSGGCPDKRVANMFESGDYNLCSIYHEQDNKALEDALYEYYRLVSSVTEL